jgi:hypothetical protein
MAFPEPPTIEDEIVLCHLRECNVNRATGSWRQNDVIKCPTRNDRLHGAAAADAE